MVRAFTWNPMKRPRRRKRKDLHQRQREINRRKEPFEMKQLRFRMLQDQANRELRWLEMQQRNRFAVDARTAQFGQRDKELAARQEQASQQLAAQQGFAQSRLDDQQAFAQEQQGRQLEAARERSEMAPMRMMQSELADAMQVPKGMKVPDALRAPWQKRSGELQRALSQAQSFDEVAEIHRRYLPELQRMQGQFEREVPPEPTLRTDPITGHRYIQKKDGSWDMDPAYKYERDTEKAERTAKAAADKAYATRFLAKKKAMMKDREAKEKARIDEEGARTTDVPVKEPTPAEVAAELAKEDAEVAASRPKEPAGPGGQDGANLPPPPANMVDPITVRDKATGKSGYIPAATFDPSQHERI